MKIAMVMIARRLFSAFMMYDSGLLERVLSCCLPGVSDWRGLGVCMMDDSFPQPARRAARFA
jgi:hypothetical protein